MIFDIDNFIFCMTLADAKTNTDIKQGSTVHIVGKNTVYYCFTSNAEGREDIGGGRFLERLDTDISYLKATADANGDGSIDPNVKSEAYIPYSIFMAAIARIHTLESALKLVDERLALVEESLVPPTPPVV